MKKKKSDDRQGESELDSRLAELREVYGDTFIERVDGHHSAYDITVTPTGIVALDRATGGGYPDGQIIEVYGPEGLGKTSIQLKVVANFQKLNKTCTFFDTEGSVDELWVEKHGVNTKDGSFIISRPRTGEQCMDGIRALIGHVDLIVVDSVTGMTPQSFLDKSATENVMADKARILSRGLDTIVSLNRRLKKKTTIVFTNQLRMKIGMFVGNPITTPGGQALKFYSVLRYTVNKIKSKLDNDIDKKGHRIKVVTSKNKFFPPRRSAEFNLMYSGQFDYEDQLVSILTELEKIEDFSIKGHVYKFKNKTFSGRENFISFLIGNSEAYNELEKSVLGAVQTEIDSIRKPSDLI